MTSLSPAEALEELLAGNERFVGGTLLHPHQDAAHRAAVAGGQRPFAVLFGCSDSRLAAEIIFDRGLGDLFVVRTAGHVIGAEVLASIDFGVRVLGTPLVVVLGHDSCGAVQAAHAALNGEEVPAGLRAITDRVIPSIRHAYTHGVTDPDGTGAVHVQRTVDMLLTECSPVAEAVATGDCMVVGLSYRLADGRVTVVSTGRSDCPIETD